MNILTLSCFMTGLRRPKLASEMKEIKHMDTTSSLSHSFEKQ